MLAWHFTPIEFRLVTSTSVFFKETSTSVGTLPYDIRLPRVPSESRSPRKGGGAAFGAVEMECTYSHRQKQNRTPNLCSARRREDDIQSGRVTDVVRTTTAAPAESRINSGCPFIRRASHPLCLTAHPQQSISILAGLALDQSSVKGSRHIRRLGRQGARCGPGTSRLLAQVCASSRELRAPSHPFPSQ